MLLKLIPFFAITLTLTALAITALWPAPQTNGLFSPAHSSRLLF